MTPFTERETALLLALTQLDQAQVLELLKGHPMLSTATSAYPGEQGRALNDLMAEVSELHARVKASAAYLQHWSATWLMQDWDAEKYPPPTPRPTWRCRVEQRSPEAVYISLRPADARDTDSPDGLEVMVEVNNGVPAMHIGGGVNRDSMMHLHAVDGDLQLHPDSNQPRDGFKELPVGEGFYPDGGGLLLRRVQTM